MHLFLEFLFFLLRGLGGTGIFHRRGIKLFRSGLGVFFHVSLFPYQKQGGIGTVADWNCGIYLERVALIVILVNEQYKEVPDLYFYLCLQYYYLIYQYYTDSLEAQKRLFEHVAIYFHLLGPIHSTVPCTVASNKFPDSSDATPRDTMINLQ